jgi:hypothetical protein
MKRCGNALYDPPCLSSMRTLQLGPAEALDTEIINVGQATFAVHARSLTVPDLYQSRRRSDTISKRRQ